MAKKKDKEEEVEYNEELDELLGDEDEGNSTKKKKVHFTIEEHDFKMISSRAHDARFFDFYYLHTVHKGKENERKEFKLEGYGYRLETCIKKICTLRAGTMPKKEYKSFKEFVENYQAQVKEVKALFDLIPEHFD